MSEIIKEKCIMTTHPKIAAEWHPVKNGDLLPSQVSYGSNKKVWWLGKCGHEWEAAIEKRILRNQGCPYCLGRRAIPGENDIATLYPKLMKLWDYEKNQKERNCPENIRPQSKLNIWWKCEKGHSWQASVMHVVNGKKCPICLEENGYVVDNYVFEMLPELVEEWDYEKNGDLHPKNVAWKSGKEIWWICSNGHSYNMSPNQKMKTDRKTKELRIVQCPICTGNRILKEYNDLATTYPELMEQWDYEKNSIDPCETNPGSHLKAWWKCNKGHSWEAVIESRSRLGRGCPVCAGQKLLKGYNDMATTNPELAKEWHPIKNDGVTPDSVSVHSHTNYWWLCANGHEWQAQPNNRLIGATGCPYCSGRFAIKGETDLVTKEPELAAEWHPTKNKVKPDECSYKSHMKAWWQCSKGHEWQAVVSSRSNGVGCPYCAGKLPIVGENDLATLMPELAEEWNYEKNKNIIPQMFTQFSNKKVWWQCSKGHEWRAVIGSRTFRKTGCPYCLGRKAIPGETDLATLRPEIAVDWNYAKNRKKLPEHYTIGSSEKVWWKCATCGSEWRSRIHTRASGGSNCPNC